MKISQNVKQDTSWKKNNSSQTVDIKTKQMKEKQCQKQNIFRQ